ncbi:CocE/NonD family hydrolase [Roseovarius salinarum]|uniref:CocE/NonD family hydrolase n=1 Tax=Roseovarius salinarum TaxID=1981892 RepID=UPI000C32C22E|nr:CocE/NonD family hydrolase [Roseovarius salinarum]
MTHPSRHQPARRVEILDPVWIEMDDGTRLAAKIWLPAGARGAPVPTVMEYIPYRRSDNKATRDHQIHAHFAAHGYASIRVDMRGSGDSEGILEDEYLPREMRDGLTILRWIAAQPWSNGRVGLFGLSWGGFNGLQIAALRPPELGAVITVCSSDDRYGDDVHYMGGCLLTDNLSWAGNMFAFNSCPPDPATVGDSWREIWRERLEKNGHWLKTWLSHQHRDAYWKQGSISEDYAAIDVPVMAVSGWRDGYTNPVFRMMENLDVPRRAIVGPWGHRYPHTGGPGPAIDFLGECLDWWDRWLLGRENGVEAEPRMRAWLMDASSPLTPSSPGRWIAEDDWPSPRLEPRTLHLGNGGLHARPDDCTAQEEVSIRSPLGVGLFAGKWCSYAEETDLPWDQRQEDGGALLFDTEPLDEPLEILGAPRVEFEVAADQPVAMIAVRLCDVSPLDRSSRVSYGVLNLCHRDSHEAPAPLEPGTFYKVSVTLNNIAQRFNAGHRVRLAVSSSYWPLAWPSPRPAKLTIRTAGSRLTLPVRPPREADSDLRPFGPPQMAEAPPTTLLAPADRRWSVNFDLASNQVALDVINNDARYVFADTGLEVGRDTRESYSYTGNDYATLRGEVAQERHFRRGEWDARTVTHTTLTATEGTFQIRATLDAYEGDARIFARSWDEEVPRDLV